MSIINFGMANRNVLLKIVKDFIEYKYNYSNFGFFFSNVKQKLDILYTNIKKVPQIMAQILETYQERL